MDKEMAWHVVVVGFRSAAQLQGLLPLLKINCNEEEYRTYLKAIAGVVDRINVELSERVFSSHPELKEEVEAKIAKYGQVI